LSIFSVDNNSRLFSSDTVFSVQVFLSYSDNVEYVLNTCRTGTGIYSAASFYTATDQFYTGTFVFYACTSEFSGTLSGAIPSENGGTWFRFYIQKGDYICFDTGISSHTCGFGHSVQTRLLLG
jgi:hypothetical protein